jgi:hypothetical protein
VRLRSAGALAGELVPAVGPQVAAGVQLAEQLPGRVALDRDPQRGRAGRAGQPERRDLGHLDPSWSSRPRRMASPRAPPTSRWALRPRRYRMGKVSLGANSRNSTSGMVTPMAARPARRSGPRRLGRGVPARPGPPPRSPPACRAAASGPPVPGCTGPPPGWRPGRPPGPRAGPSCPSRPGWPPEWPGPLGGRAHRAIDDHDEELGRDESEDQLPEAPQRQQGQHQPQPQGVEDPPRREEGQPLPGPHQPGGVQFGQPPDHRIVQDRDRDGGPRSPPAKTTTDSATSTPEATSQPTPVVCR